VTILRRIRRFFYRTPLERAEDSMRKLGDMLVRAGLVSPLSLTYMLMRVESYPHGSSARAASVIAASMTLSSVGFRPVQLPPPQEVN
jgi:hypothetical protein